MMPPAPDGFSPRTPATHCNITLWSPMQTLGPMWS